MDKVQLNLSFHNLGSMIEDLQIFVKHNGRYSIISTLKLNDRRAIYLVKDNVQSDAKKEIVYKVLKFLLQVNTTDEQYHIYRFYQGINHPNFCKIESIEEIDRFVMIVQEYIKGVTLREYFQANLSKAQKYRILFDLIFALDYIHQYSIIHGDIKPDNIIVRTDNTDRRFGTPVVIDYDLGKDMSNANIRLTKKPFGTNLYMSPEMINGQMYSFKTDIWSLGMTLYSCIIPTKIIQSDLYHVMNYDYLESSSNPTSPTKTSPTSPTKTMPSSPTKMKTLPSCPLFLTDSLNDTSTKIESPKRSNPSKLSPVPNSQSSINLGGTSLDLEDKRSIKVESVRTNINLDDNYRQSYQTRSIDIFPRSVDNPYDFDNMVYQLDRNRALIKKDYGNIFYNTIRVMLLKDYKRRPSAQKLKSVVIRSKYYLKLYPQNTKTNKIDDTIDSDSDSCSAEMFTDSNCDMPSNCDNSLSSEQDNISTKKLESSNGIDEGIIDSEELILEIDKRQHRAELKRKERRLRELSKSMPQPNLRSRIEYKSDSKTDSKLDSKSDSKSDSSLRPSSTSLSRHMSKSLPQSGSSIKTKMKPELKKSKSESETKRRSKTVDDPKQKAETELNRSDTTSSSF